MTPQNEKLIEEASGAATQAHIQCCRGYALDNDKALRLIELTRSLISALAAALSPATAKEAAAGSEVGK